MKYRYVKRTDGKTNLKFKNNAQLHDVHTESST